MKQVLQFNKVIRTIIIIGDLCLLNIIFIAIYHTLNGQALSKDFSGSLPQVLVLLNLIYILCNYHSGIILYERIVRPEQIITRAIRHTCCHALFFISIISLIHYGNLSTYFLVTFYCTFVICLIAYRLAARNVVKLYRRSGGNSRSVIFVGGNENMQELYHEMIKDPTAGFHVLGYFAETPSTFLPEKNFYLGEPSGVIPFLRNVGAENVYCSLPSAQSQIILPIINYCENHMIRFYSVPNVRNYLKRNMYFELLGNVPILSIRQEPLTQPENRLLKRAFDFVFSLLFLCTLFPIIYIVIGIAIKLSSPGPVFFRQKRSGEDGKEFYCYKFRSMRVNGDSDKVQATKNDPRKTKLGCFLRKSNLDELPQFINVLKGEMSVVGPRPHMLKHTMEYSKLIDRYMVRHLVKPGVTGWAQVNGFRGETHELWEMEGRVKLDIWYLEHWTFLLDIYIIYRTLRNIFKGEKKAY
ncbi:MAG: undecaprenyl-phosphate glucose phosphotransferase [Bacteroides sp.]|nr:undecaprenyl-phosphate glucose phosphotransferase [Bacteroides sp.]